MKKNIYSAILFLCCIQHNYSAIIAKGNSTSSPFGFDTAITTRVLDPFSGIFYVGLNGDASSYNLSRIGRYVGQENPHFVGFAPDELHSTINYLALSSPLNAPAELVGSDADNKETVFIIKNDGTHFSRTTDLNNANNTTTGSVFGVTANNQYIIAAVSGTSTTGWGDANSGLALVRINGDLSLTPKDATTGLNGNKALQLDLSNSEFTGGTTNVVMSANSPHLLYDLQLDRFYIGISMNTNTNGTDQALAIALVDIDGPNNNLALSAITNVSNIDSANNQIVVAEGASIPLTITKMGILHASTGPSYLIVAGGNTNGGAAGNTVYALPLVDNQDDVSIHGTLADKSDALVDGRFTNAATNASELLDINVAADKLVALVGATSLPVSGYANISDMVIVGDTVYISSNTSDSDNDPGIFYSQALFDSTGKIIGWTPWTKKGIPTNAFPNVLLPDELAHDGTIAFFQVDAANGKIWYVDNQTKQVVGSNSWTSAAHAPINSLAYQLNKAMPNGVQVVLDLDQSTRGFADNDPGDGTFARYALFGGGSTIAFARTSITKNNNDSVPIKLNDTQIEQTDFSNPENFLVTQLPSNAGCCQTLEYSRRNFSTDNPEENFFFAGTSNGLYAFAASDKSGFGIKANTVNALNADPFDGEWFSIDTITGSVIAIRSTGRALYILTQTTTPTLKSIIYKVYFTANINTMFAISNIITIAQTGDTSTPTFPFTNFKDITVFNDIAVNDTKEQLLVATSNGIYRSFTTNGINHASVTSPTLAQWDSIDLSKNSLPFLGISVPDNTLVKSNIDQTINPTTCWPFALVDPTDNKLFNKGCIYQVGSDSTDVSDFTPLDFSSEEMSVTFNALEPIINMYTDGGRRFFVLNRDAQNTLAILPFANVIWNIQGQPYIIINDPQLVGIKAIYWIRQIGATGLLLMGTDKGVYTLS